VRFPESWSSTSLVNSAVRKTAREKFALDTAFALIEGHPSFHYGKREVTLKGWATRNRAGSCTPYCTVNLAALVAVPPGVVMEIFTAPGTEPAGTSAVTWESEFTVTLVATIVPNFTAVAWINPLPWITTGVPTGPIVGLNVVMAGVTMYDRLLVSVVAPVVTVTGPECAPTGTFAVI
jgi:hypothetical protein